MVARIESAMIYNVFQESAMIYSFFQESALIYNVYQESAGEETSAELQT